jgi:ribonuclease-3
MESTVYSPYNPKNREFRKEDVEAIVKGHGLPTYSVRSIEPFQRAVTHTSYVRRKDGYTTPSGQPAVLAPCPEGVLDLKTEHYERHEFLGDSMIGASVSNYIWDRFPTSEPGFMTDLRKKIVNNKTLGTICQKIGLDAFYVISRHVEEACGGRTNLEKLGDIMEAFLAALWNDLGCDFAQFHIFVTTLIEKHLKITQLLLQNDNYKDLLQKHCQKLYKYTPTYHMISSDVGGFTMGVVDPTRRDVILGTGKATTKQQAEQNAAKEALTRLKVV